MQKSHFSGRCHQHWVVQRWCQWWKNYNDKIDCEDDDMCDHTMIMGSSAPSINNGVLRNSKEKVYGSMSIPSRAQQLTFQWPFPLVTRTTVIVSVIVSLLKALGALDITCSAPSTVLYRFQFLDLALSPFLFSMVPQSIILFGWNAFILGLQEESLSNLLGSTHRFIRFFCTDLILVSALRQVLGYVFSRSTGFACPLLFFSNAMHECNQGLSPFLYALLFVQLPKSRDRYTFVYKNRTKKYVISLHKITTQLLMLLVNMWASNTFWWSLTGVLVGCLLVLTTQAIPLRRATRKVSKSRRQWTLPSQFWPIVKRSSWMGGVVIAILLVTNLIHLHQPPFDAALLNNVSYDPYLFTMVVMTAPRQEDPPFLTRTLESYLTNFPVDPEPESLYSRIQIIVYNHFTKHAEYDRAFLKLSGDPKGRRYIKWVREPGNKFDHRLHLSKALALVADTNSTYVALMEDDFPLCGPNEWNQLERVIYKAIQLVPSHCGVFVGTGGSGLFMKPPLASRISALLPVYEQLEPDIIIQKCLRGDLPECQKCSGSLVTSQRLLMYHIGYRSSTSKDRSYNADEFQCGWRHPFNGDPSVVTL